MAVKKLTDAFDLYFLQNIQDAFSDATGMASIITDLEGPVTRPSNFTVFCNDLTRKAKLGFERCNQCDLNGGEESSRTGRPHVYYCHAGLMDFAAPIIVDGVQVGSILGGQVLPEPPNEAKFREIAKELRIDPDLYIEALGQVKIVPERQIRQSAELLYLTMSQISNMQTQYELLERSHQIIQNDINYINEQIRVFGKEVDTLSADQKNLLSQLINLNNVVFNVNQIVAEVVKFSKKIKLISVNASVEAARSGLMGKGFGVIAQEIRNLADETNKTVNQIEDYTQDIIAATTQVLQISQSSNTSLEYQVERLESVFPKLGNILDQVNRLSGRAVYED